ncbi:dihydrodipicolinate synthase family protein [Microbacterium sp. EST19A]|uniref:dihydrodipicolinate synthase family protein n=1 Tax=Microbacterium sp. EST19A TaxID=2862681 RepID=UPI001CBD40D1|nr:dihydrodipicolinate synthase family protein [Microbacterium sp. EST19A]
MSLSTPTSANPSTLPNGVIPALPTPLTVDRELDEPALRALIDRAVGSGVDGVLVLGSSGEVASVGTAVRERTVEVGLDAVGGRVPVIVGVAATDLHHTRADVERVCALPIAAVLVAPPSYGVLDQRGVIALYEDIAGVASTPVLGYHIPAFTGVRLEPATVAHLAASGALAGVKDSNRDLEYLQQVIAIGDTTDRPWFTYVGTDSLILPSILLGAAGGITLASSVAPGRVVRLVDAIRTGDLSTARHAQAALTKLILALRRGPFPAGAKGALALQGICTPTLAAPLTGLSTDELRELETALIKLDVPDLSALSGGVTKEES